MFAMMIILTAIVPMSTRQGITISKYGNNVGDDSGHGDVSCGYDHDGEEGDTQTFNRIALIIHVFSAVFSLVSESPQQPWEIITIDILYRWGN